MDGTYQDISVEHRWQVAAECAMVGIWEYDLATGQTYVSESWYKLRGLEPSTNAPFNEGAWLANIHPDDLDLVKSKINIERAGHSDTISFEHRERHSNGTWIWLTNNGKIICNPAGKPLRFIGTNTDITAIKNKVAPTGRQRLSEGRWRTAIENSGQGLWDIEFGTGARFHSDSWYSMRGLSPLDTEASSFENWVARLHPEDRPWIVEQIYRQHLGETEDIIREYRELHKDGHYIWILNRGRLEFDDSGKLVAATGIDTDISPRKRQEEELQQITRRFQHAMHTSEVCVWEYDLRLNLPLWDASMKQLFGVGHLQDPLPPDIWESCIHPDDLARASRTSELAVTTQRGYNMDYRILMPNGGLRHIRCRAAYHVDATLGPRLVGASWDVSQDVQTADELERAKRSAEQKNEALESARSLMEYNALHDALTGLYNRRAIDDRLEQIDSNPHSYGPIGILHVDLDRFKQINDTLGHRVGDLVLGGAAEILRECAGWGAMVARTGGDEFIILRDDAFLPGNLEETASKIINRLKQPMIFDGHECLLGASVGIAFSVPTMVSAKQLLVNADIALYAAKNAGRNRYSLFSADVQIAMLKRKSTADAIERGLHRGEFMPFYQLQYESANFRVTGVEALLRWQHPERGIVTPDQFLGVAEEMGVLGRLDQLVMERALADMETWHSQGIDIPQVSVNVSARRLADDGLLSQMRKLSLPPKRLSFELLESIYLDDHNEAIAANLKGLRELGVGLEIDDFGTGHASIACLLSLRPDRFKIDRSLIRSITESDEQRSLVSSIVDIGKALGIAIVAEGVETLDHARILYDLGCEYLQGYYFARPMAAADIVRKVNYRSAASTAA